METNNKVAIVTGSATGVGAYQMSRAAAPYLKKAGGSIVNTSIAGLTGMGSSIAYCASKGAMNTLNLSLAQTLGLEIWVNAVCPGFIETRWARDFLGDRYEEVRQQFEDSSALKLTSKPEDTAEAIVYFITQAKVATGQLLTMDGWVDAGASDLRTKVAGRGLLVDLLIRVLLLQNSCIHLFI